MSNFNYLTVNGERIQINYLLDALTFFSEVIGVNSNNKSLTEKSLSSQLLYLEVVFELMLHFFIVFQGAKRLLVKLKKLQNIV